jgi:Ca2+-binding RTX toxin-like protein
VVPSGWTITGTADFNNDGQLDAVVTNGTSANQIWLLNNGTVSSTVSLSFYTDWPLLGVGDFNGDGNRTDLLYESPTLTYQNTGQLWQSYYYFNGTTYTGYSWGTGRTADAVGSLSDEGTDTVQASISYTLPSEVENLMLANGAGHINGTGNGSSNVIIGNEGANRLTGLGGADTLTGGTGVDTFVFANGDTGAAVGSRDLITDLTVGTDLIDLIGLDANTGVAGTNAFRFLGTAAFDGQAGGLRYFYDTSRGVTLLEGDTNGNNVADFAIDLTGNKALTSASFTAGSLLVPLNLTGTTGADTLNGGELGDTLSGLGSNDTLTGNRGNDYLDGGSGADTMIAAPATTPTWWTVPATW